MYCNDVLYDGGATQMCDTNVRHKCATQRCDGTADPSPVQLGFWDAAVALLPTGRLTGPVDPRRPDCAAGNSSPTSGSGCPCPCCHCSAACYVLLPVCACRCRCCLFTSCAPARAGGRTAAGCEGEPSGCRWVHLGDWGLEGNGRGHRAEGGPAGRGGGRQPGVRLAWPCAVTKHSSNRTAATA